MAALSHRCFAHPSGNISPKWCVRGQQAPLWGRNGCYNPPMGLYEPPLSPNDHPSLAQGSPGVMQGRQKMTFEPTHEGHFLYKQPFPDYQTGHAQPSTRLGDAKCVLVYPITGRPSQDTQFFPPRGGWGYHKVTKPAKKADTKKMI